MPPGCFSIPGDQHPGPCLVCGGDPEGDISKEGACVCPECPQCGEVGNPVCYDAHGLTKTAAQIAAAAKAEQEQKAILKSEQAFWDNFGKNQPEE